MKVLCFATPKKQIPQYKVCNPCLRSGSAVCVLAVDESQRKFWKSVYTTFQIRTKVYETISFFNVRHDFQVVVGCYTLLVILHMYSSISNGPVMAMSDI